MKYKYELRQVDALWYDDGWSWNESCPIEDVELEEGMEKIFCWDKFCRSAASILK